MKTVRASIEYCWVNGCRNVVENIGRIEDFYNNGLKCVYFIVSVSYTAQKLGLACAVCHVATDVTSPLPDTP